MERHDVLDPKTVALIFSLGCVANFFDVLFSPAFAPTYVAFLGLTLGARMFSGLRYRILGSSALVTAWFAGFALTWLSRWLFAASILPWRSVFDDVRYKMLARSFGDQALDYRHPSLFDATQIAFKYIGWSAIEVCGAIAVSILAYAIYRHRLTVNALKQLPLLFTPLIIPVVWVELLRDHTLLHPGFESRAFIFFAVIPVLAALEICRVGKNAPTPMSAPSPVKKLMEAIAR
jgi:hypothetical protein